MRSKLIDDFLPKVEELVDRSRGKVGADAVHKKIVAMGFTGTDRTTRRAAAAAKESYRAGNRRVFRPWIPEPAMWMQWDWGEGPRIGSRRTSLWCTWPAWSRFRVVIPVIDKTLPTVAACLDATFRAIGGEPTYRLTDNEKTVTVEHVARIAVRIRNPELVPMARHYGTVGADLHAGRPGLRGRDRVDGSDRQAGPGARTGEPADRVHRLRRAEGSLRGLHDRGEQPRPPRDPPDPHRAAGRGTSTAAPGARAAVHRRVRREPPGRQGLDDLGQLGALLGPARARRGERLGPLPRRRPDRHRHGRGQRGRGRPACPLHPGQPAHRRRALPRRPARRTCPEADQPGRGPVPGPRTGSSGLAH
ncbi:Mobile element protein [Kitasatospora purpeofusca]